MLTRIFHHVGTRYPHAFHWLRKLPEANYGVTKRLLCELLERLDNPRVLDAGCGTGEFSSLFDPSRYLGADISAEYLELARQMNPGYQYEAADLTTWNGGDRQFDLVLVHGLLHHLDDAASEAVLEGITRVIADDGVALIVEDVTLPGFRPLEQLLHHLDVGDHIREPGAWRRLVTRHFFIEEQRFFHSGICPYIWFFGPPR